jgi:hypothetical protein
LSAAYLDQLLAPVALYPDQLLAQMLMCSGSARKVRELDAWLKDHAQLKGSALQDAASQAGFEPSFVALAPFPQVVALMAGNPGWTSQLGGAFAVERSAVFDSVQRLRKQSQAAGNLKSTPQQTVENKTTQAGQAVIVIEPANPQVVYVPQYDPQVVYVQPTTTTTTVIVQEEDDDDAAVAGAVIGFAAGVAIGAAINDNHYYGPYGAYGYRGGAYMYNDAWDDWYDDREDAREDFYENREDAREDWSDNREDARDSYEDRRENASENRSDRASEAREERGERASSAERSTSRSERSAARAERSGTRSDAFSGYSSGSATRDASSRGQRSRSRSSGGNRRR